MKSLQTLLKVAQRRMDELGVEATRLGQRIEQMRMDQAAIVARAETEALLAAGDLQLAAAMPAYRQRVKQKLTEINTTIMAEEASLAAVRARLSEAYQEKSKFEQLLEREALRKAAERRAMEQSQLDEVAINRVGFVGK